MYVPNIEYGRLDMASANILIPPFFLTALDDLPAEIKFIMEEIRIKDGEVAGT